MSQQMSHSRLIDCGNGSPLDNILIGLFLPGTTNPYYAMLNGNQNLIYNSPTSVSYNLKSWAHIALTYSSFTNKACFYLNGGQPNCAQSLNNLKLKNTTRNQCYIGRSDWSYDPLVVAYFDEIKIYNAELTSAQVLSDMYYQNNQMGQNIPAQSKINIFLFYFANYEIKKIQFYNFKVPGLVHYWPIVDGFTYDFAATGIRKDMTGSAFLTTDRFGQPYSALQIYPKFMSVPPGVYLSAPFTITVWIYLKSYSPQYARILDFGNGANFQNVVFAFNPNTGNINFGVWNDKQQVSSCVATNYQVPLFTWSHVAVAYNSNNAAYIYANGILLLSCNMYSNFHLNTKTSNNYIGRSNWPDEQSAEPGSLLNGVLDDLKIYDRVLSPGELEIDKSLTHMTSLPLGLSNINLISKN